MAVIAIYKHHPYCSDDSASGFKIAMGDYHLCVYIDEKDIDIDILNHFDMVVFPGGVGDSDIFDSLLTDKIQIITQYVKDGGKYLGICMGAYWAGSNYFNLFNGVDAVQYIKQPEAQKRRSYGTVVNVEWNGNEEEMYFYDGCTFKSTPNNPNVFDGEVIACYSGNVLYPAAIIQGNVGAIGPHPESLDYWYDTWSYMPRCWHEGRHHKLLREFVKKLLG